MLRHIVFFTIKPTEPIDEIIADLDNLRRIPHSRHFEIVRNRKIDPIGNDIDVAVYGEFDDEAALQAFKQHPLYDQTTRKVQPRRDLRFSVDYVAEPPRQEDAAAQPA